MSKSFNWKIKSLTIKEINEMLEDHYYSGIWGELLTEKKEKIAWLNRKKGNIISLAEADRKVAELEKKKEIEAINNFKVKFGIISELEKEYIVKEIF